MNTDSSPRRAFVLHLVSEPGVDAIKSFRLLLKFALRRLGLRAIDAREVRSRELHTSPTLSKETNMSAFSERIRSQSKGTFKVADFEKTKELALTIASLDEAVQMFGKEVDLLNFVETGKQLQLNQTTAEFLLDNFGDDPKTWPGKKLVLYLTTFEYQGETKSGIRLRLLGTTAPKPGDSKTRAQSADVRKPDLDDEIAF
jgi:hypothetical protein